MNVSVIYSIHPHAETLKRELLHIKAFLAKKILRNRYPKDKRRKARSDRVGGVFDRERTYRRLVEIVTAHEK